MNNRILGYGLVGLSILSTLLGLNAVHKESAKSLLTQDRNESYNKDLQRKTLSDLKSRITTNIDISEEFKVASL